jgi:hypothetical protein
VWLIIGLALGAGVVLGVLRMRARGVRTAWYEWLLAAIGVLLIMFAIENARTFSAEFEPAAAGKSILIFGMPGALLILVSAALVLWRFIRRARATRRRSQAE